MRAGTTDPVGPIHSWVVRLARHGQEAPGIVGPFPSEDDACAWASTVLAGSPGWEWSVEVVVSPASLPGRAEPARRRHLRLVGQPVRCSSEPIGASIGRSSAPRQ
jgi:hypothetical protein